MKSGHKLSFGLVFLTLIAAQSFAELVTYNFSGVLQDPFGSYAVGTPFTGSFNYEQIQRDYEPDERGVYFYKNVTLQIGTDFISYDNDNYYYLYIYDNSFYPTDLIYFQASPSGTVGGQPLALGGGLLLILQDDGDALSGVSLPGPNSLSNFPLAGSALIELHSAEVGFPPQMQTARGWLTALYSPLKLTCQGFEPPMDNGLVSVKKGKALPFKTTLFNSSDPATSNTILPPVIQVLYSWRIGEAVDITAYALGQGTEGNQFKFDGTWWYFNLATKNFTAPGTYTVSMVSGDPTNYIVDPACKAHFVIK